jgi:hypothetical protein
MVNPPLAAPARPGVALLEIVVASVILGVAISAVLGLMGRTITTQAEGERLEVAARLADERLALVLAVGAEAYPSIFGLHGPCDEPFQSYQHDVRIDAATAGLPYRVRATISWTQAGRLRSVMLETLVAPRLGVDPDPERAPQETITRAQG